MPTRKRSKAGEGGKVIYVPVHSPSHQFAMGGKPRAPTSYNLFVKENMPKVKHIPSKERFTELGKMWRQCK
jgi:hypothetical protein